MFESYTDDYNIKMTSILSSLRNYKPSLKNRKPYYFLSVLVFAGLGIGFYFDIPYCVVFFIYGLIPLMDQYASQDWTNPTLKEIKELENEFMFKLVVYLTVMLEWIAYVIVHIIIWQMSFIKGLALTALAISFFGVGFMLSHELIHKGFMDKVIGTLDQIKVFYGHFTIQHVYGHHKRVATPADPASAPKGMTVYEFLPKSIIGSYKSSFELNSTLTIGFTICYFLFMGLIYYVFSLRGLILSFILGVGAILMLQVINYVQHYGLRRKQLPDGTYEKVTIRHSWNAPHRMSNYLLFKLQRHSDHHENAMKPYQTLCSYEDSPQLPHGYVVCIIMALFPRTWFEIMDPLVEEYNRDDKTKGAELKQMQVAQKKTLQFVRKVVKVTGTLAALEIASKLITTSYSLIAGY